MAFGQNWNKAIDIVSLTQATLVNNKWADQVATKVSLWQFLQERPFSIYFLAWLLVHWWSDLGLLGWSSPLMGEQAMVVPKLKFIWPRTV